MINTDRIVPIQKVDLISMYALILQQSAATLAPVSAVDAEGNFEITEAETPLIANEPVSTCDIDTEVTEATIYFVPAYDYAGFTVDGSAATIAENDVTVNPDGRSLYKAELASGTITITQVGF